MAIHSRQPCICFFAGLLVPVQCIYCLLQL